LAQACRDAEIHLEQSLKDLEHNKLKGRVLKEEKAIVQSHIRKGLAQVKVVHAATQTVSTSNTTRNVQILEHALLDLDKIKEEVGKQTVPEHSAVQATPPDTSLIRQIYAEVRGFLSSVADMGWDLVMKTGLLATELVAEIPLAKVFVSRLKQRIETRILQARTEDREKLIKISHLLNAIFNEIKGKEMFSQIQAQTANTDVAAHAALRSEQKAVETKEAVNELRQENAELREKLSILDEAFTAYQDKVKEGLSALEAGQNQILAILLERQPQLPALRNEHNNMREAA